MERRRQLLDVVIPGAILAVGIVELVSARPVGTAYGAGLEVVTALLLVGRRRWPLVTCTTAAVVMLWMPWAGPQLDDLATPILFLALICYSLGRWLADLRGAYGLAVLLAMFLLDYVVVDTRAHGFGDVVFVATLVLPPYVFGRIVRRLEDQRRLLSEQQEQLRAQAVRDERDRIAREMHDVIAHSISAMVVQTAAAQDLLRDDPGRAAAMLEQVAEAGRSALAETGRLLHLIRDESDELGLRPAPGLADLPGLVASYRDSGLEVEADLDLPEHPVPGGVDVSAYRLVQEALTNALKHGTGPVRLLVAAPDDELRIRCSNRVDGRRAPGSGLGLQGMAERVAVLGGSLRHGAAGDRFEVDVVIPLAGQVVA